MCVPRAVLHWMLGAVAHARHDMAGVKPQWIDEASCLGNKLGLVCCPSGAFADSTQGSNPSLGECYAQTISHGSGCCTQVPLL